MAREEKLPDVIKDVIRQHHGTTLIQYFYHQAQSKEQATTAEGQVDKTGHKKVREDATKKVDESTYRYDGPKPEFKESAIIFFADSVEAASRSIKKITQPNVEDLMDHIFKSRIDDGQLDKCPLTFYELDQIRKSFIFTILNMQHARVEYPKTEAEKDNMNHVTDPVADAKTKSGNKQPV